MEGKTKERELRVGRDDDHVILGIFELDEETNGQWVSRTWLTPSAARKIAAALNRIADQLEAGDE